MAVQRHSFWICSISLLLVVPGTVFAQNSANNARTTRDTLSALNRFESFTPNAQFATASPADPDLGEQLLLTPAREYRPFSFGTGYSTTWTSNAFYTPSTPSSDVLMSAYAEAIALPHLGGNYFLEASANFTGYRYFRNPVLDFNSLETTAGLLKVFREFHDVGLYARYEFTYLFGTDGGDLLTEHSLVTGLRKTFQFSRANALFVAAEADFVVGGEPGYALAHNFSLFAAHQLEWSRYFQTSLFYQGSIYDFIENGRADFRNSGGLNLGFKPVKWLTISATSWLGWNASNQSDYNYFVANLGGSINASINF